jgi:hypothetical protein
MTQGMHRQKLRRFRQPDRPKAGQSPTRASIDNNVRDPRAVGEAVHQPHYRGGRDEPFPVIEQVRPIKFRSFISLNRVTISAALARAALRSSWAWIAFSMRHFGYFPVRHVAEHIPVPVNDAPLPVRLRKHLRGRVHKSSAGIRNDQPYSLQAPLAGGGSALFDVHAAPSTTP